jgi:pyruvate,water dikinase
MSSDVVGFDEIDRTQVALVGGKGANLGELSRIDGIRVPAGFCVTTSAFRRIIATASLDEHLDRLSFLNAEDHDAVRTLSAEVRRTIEGTALPDDLAAEISRELARLGDHVACAVRSSATTEDMPTASFAGQHDTYLNVVGATAVLQHVSRCWASLFTERAVIYRRRNGVDQRRIDMAVVVQRMVDPDAAGVMFTADPVSGDRTVVSVEAVRGVGEALVSGRMKPDVYTVRNGEVVATSVADQDRRPTLTDGEAARLAAIGRRIEAHFGCPQDIEWCHVDDDFQIVQSRPITTLFPVPEIDDGQHHVFVSVGHQQMMTNAMKPLGLSFWKLTAGRPMYDAGGRLFVDVAEMLASPPARDAIVEGFGRSDPLTGDALRTIVERGDLVPSLPDQALAAEPPAPAPPPPAPPPPAPPADPPPPLATDPAVVTDLIAQSEASIAELERDISTRSGTALIDFVRSDIAELKRILFDPRSHEVWMSAMEATWWLNDHLEEWLGEKNVADTLSQSVPHNVTSEMGLALLDVADVIRPLPEVVAFLREVDELHHIDDDEFLDALAELPGGPDARAAIQAFLDRYGMRCVGEIDITRPRWSERPTALVPVILGNVENFESGAAAHRFELGRQEALAKESEVMERVRALPDGEQRAAEVEAKIDRVRTFIGYREYPKYGMVSRYFVYKHALAGQANQLVHDGVLRDQHDIDYLTLDELHEVVRTNHADHELIERRKDAFRTYEALTPPRVLTSDGEILAGSYRRDDVPAGALAGLAVSAGVVEGRARVIHDMTEANVEPGDILVTACTDPSWSPLFVSIAGLVTEVGGLMTHGAVIAREYGLPAVVAADRATTLIADGQRIRVDGTNGYVEIVAGTDG